MVRFDKKELTAPLAGALEFPASVRFQDVDAAGIVFFSRFFDYVHGAYELLLTRAGIPLAQALEDRSWAAPLRHVESDYLAPVRFGDPLKICLARAVVEDSEVTLGWSVWCRERPVAAIQTVHVFVDPSSFRRVRVPEGLAEVLELVPGNK